MGERRGTKALELWCRRMTDGYPGVKIDNMTTSWRDGLAFCAMIHHFRPELIEFDKLNKSDVYYNNELAFRTAELHLGIPALLDAADMVTYEVPDRLSILTYLSQYYQVFGVTDPTSPSRLNIAKRPSPATDKNTITKQPGPPAKMAHVGVPRREPCHKCGLPVFLAERLNIGQKLYHRTCLKCARCNTQLTPGSFYETEIDSEFCCEQCPDEELLLKTEQEQEEKTKNLNLLQKSLSDEEKRKSLQRYQSLFNNDLNSSISSNNNINYKKNNFMDKFMSSQINNDDEVLQQQTTQQIKDDKDIVKIDTDDNNVYDDDDDDNDDEDGSTSSISKDINDIPPKLPTSQPPPATSTLSSPSSSARYSPINKNIDPGAVNISPTLNHNSNDSKPPTINNLSDLRNNKNENNVNIDEPLDANNTSINVVTKDVLINDNVGNINVKKRLQQFESLSQNYNNINNSSSNRKSQINIKLKYDDVANDITDTQNSNSNNKVPMTTVENTTPSDIISNVNNKDISECVNNISDNDCIVNNDNMCVLSNNNNNIKNNASNDLNEIINQEKDLADKNKVTTDPSNVIHKESIDKVNESSSAFEEIKGNEMPKNDNIIGEKIKEEENIISDEKKVTEDKSMPKVDTEEVVDKVDDKDQTMVECSKVNVLPEEETVLQEIGPVKEIIAKVVQDEQVEGSPKLEEIEIIKEKVPITDDNEKQNKNVNEKNIVEKKPNVDKIIEITSPSKTLDSQNTSKTIKRNLNDYPIDLNPFGSDDDDEKKTTKDKPKQSLNPFGSEDDDEDNNESNKSVNKPPRPPPPKAMCRISTNPFGSDTDDDEDNSNIVTSSPLRTPVPTPRITKNLPEPQPRSVKKLNDFSDLNKSLDNFNHSSDFRGSTNSIASSTTDNSFTTKHHSYHKKGKAPPPPTLTAGKTVNKDTLAPESAYKSIDNSPCSSQTVSPKTTPKLKKKRPAPLPPSSTATTPHSSLLSPQHNTSTNNSSINVSIASSLNETNDEMLIIPENNQIINNAVISEVKQRIIPLELNLLDDNNLKKVTTNDIMYRNRTVIPLLKEIINDSHEYDGEVNGDDGSHDRQWEKMKDNKESQNRNRQSQISLPSPNNEIDQMYSDKSAHGKWKRRKGPAPALPVPPRKEIQMLPLQAIKHELEVIEVQQQGLEKQGVMLEKMIRERCEGPGVGEIAERAQNGAQVTVSASEQQVNDQNDINDDKLSTTSSSKTSIVIPPHPTTNSKEVEDLIMQLFELVNEKNELFRRQAELMYLRRQHRLEHEQADLEYEIRVLMAQPERNKTDTDKEREELLIARLVEVVQLRNEVIDCLEMDRLREAEEDMSIKQQIEIHSAKRDEELSQQTPTKLSKKEKKKQKEAKKLAKNKKMDADKDADESELTGGSSSNTLEKPIKKKKKKFLFLTN